MARVILLTSFGSDGAATAALALRKHPQAQIIATSAGRLAETLRECSGVAPAGASRAAGRVQVLICGVGVNDGFAAVRDALQRLHDAGAEVIWLCGRGYMREYQPELQSLCKTVFTSRASNAECALNYLALKQDLHSQLLLELAADFVEGRPVPEDRQWWHDYLRASADRYFQYDDATAFVEAVRLLSSGEELGAQQRQEVLKWRAGGRKAVPLGNSAPMKQMRRMIAKLGPVEAPVLILGPSGAGKELTARLLHESSRRRGGPFVAVNCAVLSASSDLASDRLFGHVAGAYTGATKDSPGAFEAAEGGTLFLDEAGELPLLVQTQLLRALEEKEISPLGTVKTRQVNVRILAATNRPLLKMVQEGSFRLDLYHRLNVLRVRVPSLAERREDIRSIARGVLHELKAEGILLRPSEEDWRAAESYDWPGNIRQLVNLLRRAAYMGTTLAQVIAEEFQQEGGEGTFAPDWLEERAFFLPGTVEEARPEAEVRRRYIRHVYDLCGQSSQTAARTLGISVNTLRAWL